MRPHALAATDLITVPHSLPAPRVRAEYREKLLRMRRNMLATQTLLTKVEKGALLLRTKLGEKAAERAARRNAEQLAYASVGPK